MAFVFAARSVILEPAAQTAHDQAVNDHTRFDEAYRGLEWLLARKPDVGVTADVGGEDWTLFVQAPDPLAETPTIAVVYRVTANEIIIAGIHVQAFER